MSQTKILLDEAEIPTHWYNVIADMPHPPAPPLGPDGKPVGPEALTPIFPMALIEQEVSAERWIPIPDPVREALRLWRPTPMFRAHRLEQAGQRELVEQVGSRRWGRPPRSSTSTKASARRVRTSRTPRSPRPTTTARPA